ADQTEVTGIDTDDDGAARGPASRPPRVQAVHTSRGTVEAEHVVVACGVWSRQVAALAGARIPVMAAVHQMADLGPIPELAERGGWITFPLIRDMDARMYARQRGDELELGSYAHRPILHEPGEIPPLGAPGQAS